MAFATKLKTPQLYYMIVRFRHTVGSMVADCLKPPSDVKFMRQLDKDKFKKTIEVPCLTIREDRCQAILPFIKRYMLKMEKLRPIRTPQNNGFTQREYREILLHPLPVRTWMDLPESELKKYRIDKNSFSFVKLDLNYDNWTVDEILKMVLPADQEGVASFSRIGHIIHLNLRDHLLPYKKLIGQVLLDKIPGCRTVVNKTSAIDNTYRNFQLELICGEPLFFVHTRENGVAFELDFSKVYWNPRLSTEHERVVRMLSPGDVLYDVFAGVGPFAVPAARKKCLVLANDLNPESYKWLQHNLMKNKCLDYAKIYNKDGKRFITEDLKGDLLHKLQTAAINPRKFHITMNLPAISTDFLPSFRGLFAEEQHRNLIDLSKHSLILPTVHIYVFAKGSNAKNVAVQMVEEGLHTSVETQVKDVQFVRNVAPNKDMYRVSFQLSPEVLMTPLSVQARRRIEPPTLRTDNLKRYITGASATQEQLSYTLSNKVRRAF